MLKAQVTLTVQETLVSYSLLRNPTDTLSDIQDCQAIKTSQVGLAVVLIINNLAKCQQQTMPLTKIDEDL